MPWRQTTPPLSRARLFALYREWLRSIGMFCVVFTFFVGLSFMLDPLLHTVAVTSMFHMWGESGVFVIGVVFVGVSLWDTLVSTREGYTMTVIVLCGFGLLSALHPVNISGLIFYLLVIFATFQPGPVPWLLLRLRQRHRGAKPPVPPPPPPGRQ